MVVSSIPTRPNNKIHLYSFTLWGKTVSAFKKGHEFFNIAAEVSNIGVLFSILGTFGILVPGFGIIPVIFDSFIYLFRACARISLALGWFFKAKDCPEPELRQFFLDVSAITLFVIATSVIIAGIFSTLAALPFAGWLFGLAGVGLIWRLDHCQEVKRLKAIEKNIRDAETPERKKQIIDEESLESGLNFKETVPFVWSRPFSTWMPFRRLYNTIFDSSFFDEKFKKFELDANGKKIEYADDNGVIQFKRHIITPEEQLKAAVNARNLYAAIILFVALSLLCAAASSIFPSDAIELLLVTRIAGGCLGVINVGRIINFIAPESSVRFLDCVNDSLTCCRKPFMSENGAPDAFGRSLSEESIHEFEFSGDSHMICKKLNILPGEPDLSLDSKYEHDLERALEFRPDSVPDFESVISASFRQDSDFDSGDQFEFESCFRMV